MRCIVCVGLGWASLVPFLFLFVSCFLVLFFPARFACGDMLYFRV